MTVRVFSSARITLDEGTLDTFRSGGILNGAWTGVATFKRLGDTTDGTQYLLSVVTGGTVQMGLSITSAREMQIEVNGIGRLFDANFTISNDVWYTIAVRRPAGTSTPVGKLWTHSGGGTTATAWTNAADTLDDDTDAPDSLQIGNRPNDFPLNGKIAGEALYDNDVGTTTGDTFGTGLQEWLDASPVGMWPLQQASTATAVEDIVGTAEQTAITGTSVDTGDDPPHFDLTLGGPGAPARVPAMASQRGGYF